MTEGHNLYTVRYVNWHFDTDSHCLVVRSYFNQCFHIFSNSTSHTTIVRCFGFYTISLSTVSSSHSFSISSISASPPFRLLHHFAFYIILPSILFFAFHIISPSALFCLLHYFAFCIILPSTLFCLLHYFVFYIILPSTLFRFPTHSVSPFCSPCTLAFFTHLIYQFVSFNNLLYHLFSFLM